MTTAYRRQFDIASFTTPGKKPYKVSERFDDAWECSCPAWTRHTPRRECKHILMDPDWARSIRDECKAGDVPFFMKQMGGIRNKRGALALLPEDLRIRQYPAIGVPNP